MATPLPDMFGNYTTVYLRKTFTINSPSDYSSLQFQAFYDDGFNLWVNGNFVTSQNAPQNPPYNGTANDRDRDVRRSRPSHIPAELFGAGAERHRGSPAQREHLRQL